MGMIDSAAIPEFRDQFVANHGPQAWADVQDLARRLVALAVAVGADRMAEGVEPVRAMNVGAYAAMLELADIGGLDYEAAMLAVAAIPR